MRRVSEEIVGNLEPGDLDAAVDAISGAIINTRKDGDDIRLARVLYWLYYLANDFYRSNHDGTGRCDDRLSRIAMIAGILSDSASNQCHAAYESGDKS